MNSETVLNIPQKSQVRDKPRRKKHNVTPSSQVQNINYHGMTIGQASTLGNLPVCVLLWGIAKNNCVNLMIPDGEGNNPVHYAALADTAEVVRFLNQQTKGMLTPDCRLLESRNNNGETPILRSLSSGKISVLKFLLEESCDPFVRDNFYNTSLIAAAKHCHLWCLSYLFKFLSEKYSDREVLELINSCDYEGHNALDWAAFSGGVNVIEFLIRKGLSPFKCDSLNRGPLYWAVSCQHPVAVRFLIRVGCNPYSKANNGKTPFEMAMASRNLELISAVQDGFSHHPSGSSSYFANHFYFLSNFGSQFRHSARAKTSLSVASTSIHQTTEDSSATTLVDGTLLSILTSSNSEHIEPTKSENINSYNKKREAIVNPLIGCITPNDYKHSAKVSRESECEDSVTHSTDKFQSHAINRMTSRSTGFILIYALISFSLWLLSIYINFLAWFALVGFVLYYFRRYEIYETNIKDQQSDSDKKLPYYLSLWSKFVCAQEKYVGIYLGVFCAFALYFFASIDFGLNYSRENNTSFDVNSLWMSSNEGTTFFRLGGISGYRDDADLFWLAFLLMLISLALWLLLVLNVLDPGIIDTRITDFDEIMTESFRVAGIPPHQQYCRTTLVKKPMRSKYCTKRCFVIARMDHFCIWLNNSIGFGNHRIFIVFLYIHLLFGVSMSALVIRAIDRDVRGFTQSACVSAELVMGSFLFYPALIAAGSLWLTVCLAILAFEQTANIFLNLTSNERINKSKYPWLHDEDGKFSNRFDRGPMINFLEFWGLFGFEIDYKNIFNISDIPVTPSLSFFVSPSPRSTTDNTLHVIELQPNLKSFDTSKSVISLATTEAPTISTAGGDGDNISYNSQLGMGSRDGGSAPHSSPAPQFECKQISED